MSSFCIMITSKLKQYILAPSPRKHKKYTMRTSFFTSGLANGSMALEGSIVATLFLLFLFSIIYIFQMISMQSTIEAAIHQTGNEIIFMGSAVYKENNNISYLSENKIYERIGREKLNMSSIAGGSEGLNSSGSYYMEDGDIVYLQITYQFKPLIRWLMPKVISGYANYYGHIWTGYDVCKKKEDNKGEMIVYMTETGSVYHEKYQCTYLHPAIQTVKSEELSSLRNKEGAIYYSCEICGKHDGSYYFTTNFGNRYHSTMQCSGLKRTIYIISLNKAIETGKRACSKCS